jgi:hypothetical protein
MGSGDDQDKYAVIARQRAAGLVRRGGSTAEIPLGALRQNAVFIGVA